MFCRAFRIVTIQSLNSVFILYYCIAHTYRTFVRNFYISTFCKIFCNLRDNHIGFIDLDMVNTYFRLTERGKMVEQKEIRLVSPNYACSGIETLSLPAEVASAFVLEWDTVVFDVGGDAAGAMSLGRYHTDFAALEEGQLEVYDIVNVFRPMSESPEKIVKLKEEMEGFARLKVTGFVNNSNLLNFASADDIRQGCDVLRKTSDMTGIPVAHTTGRKCFLEEFLRDGRDPKYIGEPIGLETYMHRSWEAFTNLGL